jgi:hypothetical protein
MLLNIIIGFSVFLLTNLCLLYTSHLVVRRFFSHATPSVRLTATGTLFYAFIIIIFQALSPLHAITKLGVTATCFLLAFSAHLAWGNCKNFNAEIEPIRTWIRDGLNSRWSALIIFCGFVILLSLSRALLMPPLAWDCITYHLTFATLWIKKGTLLFFNAPDQIAENVHFPINGNIFAAWLLLPFRTDLLVNVMNFPITFLGGIACYSIARELGLNRREASFAPALICFAPMIYAQITTQYIDNAVFAFSMVSVLFSLRYLTRGDVYDGIFSIVAAGILLGIKYTGIPVVGIIFVVTTLKTVRLVGSVGLLKKAGLIIVSVLILCSLGGRQYLLNAFDAGNPLYPLPFNIFGHEILEGSLKLDQINEYVLQYEKNLGWDKFSLWEKEYRRFTFEQNTAGPKFFIFLFLALISLFIKPSNVSKANWFFLIVLWVLPIVLFYTNSIADFARRANWIESSTRFLSFPIALYTIQGLFIVKKVSKYIKEIDFLLVVFIALDLLYVNKVHLQNIAALYPFIVFMIFLIIILFNFFLENLKSAIAQEKISYVTNDSNSKLLFRPTDSIIGIKWIVCIVGLITLFAACYFFQIYRDNTRYSYYRFHFDYSYIPRNFVNAWEFLDDPNEKKTIAMTMGWDPPGHQWFFYPLLGRRLQNDVVYLSAKYKWSVPSWLHRGQLRGNDFSIWRYNLKRKKADYIFMVKPWPIELRWLLSDNDNYKLIFTDRDCKIFKVIGENT